jgi:hypothetical protein
VLFYKPENSGAVPEIGSGIKRRMSQIWVLVFSHLRLSSRVLRKTHWDKAPWKFQVNLPCTQAEQLSTMLEKVLVLFRTTGERRTYIHSSTAVLGGSHKSSNVTMSFLKFLWCGRIAFHGRLPGRPGPKIGNMSGSVGMSVPWQMNGWSPLASIWIGINGRSRSCRVFLDFRLNLTASSP